MKIKRQLFLGATILSLLLNLFITGCATVDPTAVGQFSTGVTAAKSQTQLALTAIATSSREEAINYAILKNELDEQVFVETPTPATIEQWDRTFTVLEHYSQTLASLVSPDAAQGFDQAAENLAAQFNATAADLQTNLLVPEAPQLSPSLATAFTKVGDLILRAKSTASARKIARATDPQIQQVFTLMAEAIGDSHATAGLRATAYAFFQDKARDLKPDFLTAKTPDAKRQIILNYSDILQKRDAQDQALTSLRRSLLALADAHHALAQGNNPSLKASVGVVMDEVARTRDLYDAFKTKLNTP